MQKIVSNITLLCGIFQGEKGDGLMKYNFELSKFKSGVNYISLSSSEFFFVIPINKLYTGIPRFPRFFYLTRFILLYFPPL